MKLALQILHPFPTHKSCQSASDPTVTVSCLPLMAEVTTDLLDIPVLVAVVCLLCTVLRDNLPVSDIKAKERSRTKPDFLHAVIFKVLEKGGFV